MSLHHQRVALITFPQLFYAFSSKSYLIFFQFLPLHQEFHHIPAQYLQVFKKSFDPILELTLGYLIEVRRHFIEMYY